MFGGNASILIGKGDGVGRGRSAASVSFLAAKAELLGTLDAMLSEGWEAAHPVEAAERGSFIMQVGLCIRRFGRRGDGSPASEEPKVCWRMRGFVSSQAFCRGRAG